MCVFKLKTFLNQFRSQECSLHSHRCRFFPTMSLSDSSFEAVLNKALKCHCQWLLQDAAPSRLIIKRRVWQMALIRSLIWNWEHTKAFREGKPGDVSLLPIFHNLLRLLWGERGRELSLMAHAAMPHISGKFFVSLGETFSMFTGLIHNGFYVLYRRRLRVTR